MHRILIISPIYWPYQLGGAEISTRLLAEGLASCEDFRVEVFTHGENKKDIEDNVNGIQVQRYCFPFFSKVVFDRIHNRNNLWIVNKVERLFGAVFSLPGRVRFYRRLFKNYDLVMLSGNGVGMGRRDMWKAAKMEAIPFVQIIRDSEFVYIRPHKSSVTFFDKIYRSVCTRGLADVPHIVGVSKRILDLHTSYGIRLNEKKVIYNAVDDTLCKKLPYGEKKDVILYVGTIGKYKGCQTLIRAFQRIWDEVPNYSLVLIGKELDMEIPHDERIVVKGQLELQEAYQFMQTAKLLILPSEWDEAFGRVLIEAVFNGAIAIGSDKGGIPEVFDHHEEYMFKAGDEIELANRIRFYAMLNEEEYERERNKQALIFRRYGLREHIKNWHEYLVQILENSK